MNCVRIVSLPAFSFPAGGIAFASFIFHILTFYLLPPVYRLGNMVFWSGICIGVTLIWVLYSRELALQRVAALAEAGEPV